MRGVFAFAALLVGCSHVADIPAAGEPVDSAARVPADAPGTDRPETDAATAIDDGVDSAMPASDARELEISRDAREDAVACGPTLACNDDDPCTDNVCGEDGKCSYPLSTDTDGDGFLPTGSVAGCAKALDCDDSNSTVFPGQSKFFAFHSELAEFDYNCDGRSEQRWPGLATCTKSSSGCALSEGWTTAVPGCGVAGKFVTACALEAGACVTSTAVERVQECR